MIVGVTVAPLAGAWIEIKRYFCLISGYFVAPLAGAWIEIGRGIGLVGSCCCRSPRGSVD